MKKTILSVVCGVVLFATLGNAKESCSQSYDGYSKSDMKLVGETCYDENGKNYELYEKYTGYVNKYRIINEKKILKEQDIYKDGIYTNIKYNDDGSILSKNTEKILSEQEEEQKKKEKKEYFEQKEKSKTKEQKERELKYMQSLFNKNK